VTKLIFGFVSIVFAKETKFKVFIVSEIYS